MNQKNKIMWSFVAIYVFVALLFLRAIVQAVFIQTVERDTWLSYAKSHIDKKVIVYSERGIIYSSDGKLMASSMPEYKIHMDTRTAALTKNNSKLFYTYVDSISYALSAYFQDRTPEEYRQRIVNGHIKKNQYLLLYPHPISFSQQKDIWKMPLFNQKGNPGGLVWEKRDTRKKPYGALADATIGSIYSTQQKPAAKENKEVPDSLDWKEEEKDSKKKRWFSGWKKADDEDDKLEVEVIGKEEGRKGLEAYYNDVLTGKPGMGVLQKVANNTTIVLHKEPEKGSDIVTTLDTRLQDIAEAALLEELHRISAKEGYVILMEVKTGEIKAIVNKEWRESLGRYVEEKNGALSNMTEPGSTFKTASLMAAIDDGYVDITDSIDVGKGICYYYNVPMKDHNYRGGAPGTGYGKITVQNALEASSNVGISQLIVKHYGKKPEKFVNKLYEMGLNDTVKLGIYGMGRPYIRSPKNENHPWSGTTLPWMSIGYEVLIPPIYTLTFYNAIANNGKMINPILVKEIRSDGEVVEEFKAKVMRDKICSSGTLQQIKTALEGVVWSEHYATARAAQSPYVRIAGKTGTAQIAEGGNAYQGHQVSFCGYFPIENPQYTCICVIRKPGAGHYPSGGRMAGSVVKNIAEKTMAMNGIRSVDAIVSDSTFRFQYPVFKRGLYTSLQGACKQLHIPLNDNYKKESVSPVWARVVLNNDTLVTKPIQVNSTLTPSVIGMGARDAIYAIEQTGMKAHTSGYGRVVSQSVAEGTPVSKGRIVKLELK